MNEIHLFAGAGGGILGSRLLGHTVIGAVEINEYCCRVLEQRQRDGMLERFPIFQTDIRDFIRCGYAELYKGRCDIVSGGFPCQPFSNAGKRKGADDERNMWPATRDCVRIIRPRFCFFENVAGLLTSGYFGTIVNDLAKSGYCVRWRILSAAEVGAPHKRDRLWILAYTDSGGLASREQKPKQEPFARCGQDVAYTDNSNEYRGRSFVQIGRIGSAQETKRNGYTGRIEWPIEPDVGRVAYGVASRVDRLRAIGNGQVPAVVATAWNLLSEGLT